MFRELFHNFRKARNYIFWQIPGNLGSFLKNHCVHLYRLIANKTKDFLNQFERSLNALGIKLAQRCCMGLSKESEPITGNQLGLDGCHDLKLRGIFSQQVAKVQDGAHLSQPTYAKVHSFDLAGQRCLAQSVFHGPHAQAKQPPHENTAGERPYFFFLQLRIDRSAPQIRCTESTKSLAQGNHACECIGSPASHRRKHVLMAS